MTDRATCWSITINNPTADDLKPSFPNNKWVMTGQIEKGEEGTEHYQGMLTTPQVRFSAVKKCLPRAHIEVAKNRNALANYVNKEDTRVRQVENISSNIPTLFDYQHTIASKWDDDYFNSKWKSSAPDKFDSTTKGDCALEYVDELVAQDIENGVCGVEYIAINPMWRSAWKKFWKQMIIREKKSMVQYNECLTDASTPASPKSPTAIANQECSDASELAPLESISSNAPS